MQDTPFSASPGDTQVLPIAAISEGYARLRVANPKLEAALMKSLSHLGQLNPVVVGPPFRGTCELLDGFKRVRILKRQGRTEILAREVPAQKSSAQKSLMFTLHGHIHGLSELEEALIVKSLHLEDGMSQGEIGMLLARHKSWVCRRIALLERLTEEVREHLVLGILPLSVGRVLCQLPSGQLPSRQPLPRGNALPEGNGSQGLTQEKMLAAILKHRLTARECESLLRHLKRRGPWEVDAILRAPYDIEPALSSPHAGKPLEAHLKLLSQMALGAIPKIRSALELGSLNLPERALLLRQTAGALERCREACRDGLQVAEEVP
jgi:ParB-like nuclease domain